MLPSFFLGSSDLMKECCLLFGLPHPPPLSRKKNIHSHFLNRELELEHKFTVKSQQRLLTQNTFCTILLSHTHSLDVFQAYDP